MVYDYVVERFLFAILLLQYKMEETLDIKSPVMFDESVAHYEIQTHRPYATSAYQNNDAIHIAIQHQDQCLLPSKSFVRIQGKLRLRPDAAPANIRLVNNAMCFLFSEIKYELNSHVIERCSNVGITSTMKGYASFTPNQEKNLKNAGWFLSDDEVVTDAQGNFEFLIPLSAIFGFAEDYGKIVVNMKHEIVFTRSNVDDNAVLRTGDNEVNYAITINVIEWLMPRLILADLKKLSLLKYIEKDPWIVMSYRVRELFNYPALPASNRHIWTVKTATQVEKPRYVIVGFQTNRNNNRVRNASQFDHINLTNIKLYLNSQCYPQENLNLNINDNKFSILYEMFASFQVNFYGKETSEVILDKTQFRDIAPLAIFDCSKQNEALKYAPVDVRLEIETANQFPGQTSVYCLILHDRMVQYRPISGEVKNIV